MTSDAEIEILRQMAETEGYDSLSTADLLVLAKANGVEPAPGYSRGDLIRLLEEGEGS